MSRKPFAYVTKSGHVIKPDVLEQYATKSAGESNALPADSFMNKYTGRNLVQPLYNPEALARILEINPYHYRACKTKARDAAGLGWTLDQDGDTSGNESLKTKIEAVFDALDLPLSMTLDRMMLDHEATGYGALEILREGDDPNGEVVNIVHIPSHTLRMHVSGKKMAQMRGSKTRWFKKIGYEMDVHMNSGREVPLGQLLPEERASELMWFINYSPRSDYYGVPDIIPALGAVHGDISRRDYNISFFSNFGVPAYAVFIAGDFDTGDPDPETGKTDLEAAIEAHFQELAKNPHSTLVLSVPSAVDGGKVELKFEKLATEVKEASFRLYRQDNRDEILAAHAVPPYRAGIAETGSLGGSTAEESTKIYKISVIEPRQQIIEAMFNRWIIWGSYKARGWKFKLSEIDTSDEKHDLDIASGVFLMGGMTPNQVIKHFGEKFGLEEVKDQPSMDAHYVNNIAVDLPDEGPDVDEMLGDLEDRLLSQASQGPNQLTEEKDPNGTGLEKQVADDMKVAKALVAVKSMVRRK